MMRQRFAEYLHKRMMLDNKIFIVTADLGYKMWDKIENNYHDRFVNYGAAEIGALAFCVGLAYQGFKPIFYSITPFALWRPAEVIRNYLNHEEAKVLIATSGRDKQYKDDGFSHDATDAPAFARMFPAINYYAPEEADIEEVTARALDNLPAIISLSR